MVRRQQPMDQGDEYDKDWARKYILDPLTAPEPSQESGISASYAQSHRAPANLQRTPSEGSSSGTSHKKRGFFANALAFRSKGKRPEYIDIKTPSTPTTDLPTPPTSASPDRTQFHHSNPFADPDARTSSRNSSSIDRPQNNSPRADRHLRVVSDPQGHRNPGSQSRDLPHRRTSSNPNPQSHRRQASLQQRYPGDMSHRPLETIKHHTKAAERGHRRGASTHHTDVIDALDTIGGTYHHGGPYDATLASRNVSKKYSPVAAVQKTNEEALRATPGEFIQDSLDHHVPLQGTAVIPPGGIDPRGRRMEYEEGADLMREPDAPGGAYKRWADVRYHPEDLKGKGEPSYTLERDMKQKQRYINPAGEYELQSPRVSRLSRPRRRSSGHLGDDSLASGSGTGSGFDQAGSVQRSNTTGKRLSDGFRRRMGSIRKRPVATTQEVN